MTPAAWEEVQLAEICLPVEKVRPDERPDQKFTYIDISSIDRGAKAVTSPQRLLGRDAPSRARQQIRAGDVLMSTVRPNLRTIARVPPSLDGEVASTGFCVLRPSEAVSPDFLFWAVLSDDLQARVIRKARGVSYPAVRDLDVLEEIIPLPPRAEQDRIAGAIEATMEAIQRGLAELTEVAAKADSLRGAVLGAALSGRLAMRHPSGPPPPDLLEDGVPAS